MSASDPRRRMPRTSLLRLLLPILLACGIAAPAHADAVLFLEEPINLLAHISATGHSALYLTSLCSDDHLHLRSCRPGESGTVISRYQGFNGKYDWIAMPPEAYLYATGSPAEVPGFVTPAQAASIRATYGQSNPFPGPVQPRPEDWIQLTGQSYRRRILCLRVHTTPAQDARLVAWLNLSPNRSRYNFLVANCADFTRRALDVLFPGAIHRNLLFDAGMTTPKQLAAALHGYARHHPELQFTVEVLPQVPGSIPRSGRIRGVTESFVKTTPYLTPLLYLDPVPFGGVIASGLLDRRYNPQRLANTAPEFTLTPPVLAKATPAQASSRASLQ